MPLDPAFLLRWRAGRRLGDAPNGQQTRAAAQPRGFLQQAPLQSAFATQRLRPGQCQQCG
jgi:hypothetical protein